MGDDRAETYLRLLAETELRRVLRLLGQEERRPDGGSDPAGGLLSDAAFRPGSDIARSAAQLSWAGDVPQHLPYNQLWAVDDQGTRYRLELVGEGETATWQGTADLSPALPPGARWLDLIADETRRLIRLDLTRPKATAPAWSRSGCA